MILRPLLAFFCNGIDGFTWHRPLTIVFALSLGACANISEFAELKKATELAVFGAPDIAIERANIDKLPYASIRAKMGRSGHVLMILGRYDGPDLHWISADHIVFATRNGRIVKTAGLPEFLANTIFLGQDPLTTSGADGAANEWIVPVTARRFVDIEPGAHYGVTISSTIERIDAEEIEILDHNYQTILLRERAYAAQLDWSFENYFWVDRETGFVWKSIQHVTPTLPPIEIEILKPAG